MRTRIRFAEAYEAGGGGGGAATPEDFSRGHIRTKQVIFGQKHLILGQETSNIWAKPLDFRATSHFPIISKRLLRVLHEYSPLRLILYRGTILHMAKRCCRARREKYSGKRPRPPPPPPPQRSWSRTPVDLYRLSHNKNYLSLLYENKIICIHVLDRQEGGGHNGKNTWASLLFTNVTIHKAHCSHQVCYSKHNSAMYLRSAIHYREEGSLFNIQHAGTVTFKTLSNSECVANVWLIMDSYFKVAYVSNDE